LLIVRHLPAARFEGIYPSEAAVV